MGDAWWRAVSPYLDRALDMHPDDRETWLRSMQEHDPAAASELEALLAQHERLARERFLEEPPAAVDPQDTRAGASVGAYTLVRPIGEGGMGTVWLAERTDGEIQHRAAVKFLGPGHRPVWRERFLRERQLLASLSHPSIVHVIDAGHTTHGRPYLVMEYVDGVPIDVYAANLTVPERLRLFLRVCEGVSHAHQHLIVHRDLKPTNILVDASGQPKLLDFGIAKLMDESGSVTQTVERLLTPQYASPEQLRGTPQSTATDIYSLGAVLYTLLTGRSPHEGQRRTAATTDPPEIVPASRLNPDVPSDANYIVGKALRDDPADRFSSVEALAADVRALLESRPVTARAGDRWYRARTFLRRNGAPIAAAVLVMASLAGGLYAANRQRAIADDRFQQVRQLANRFIALDAELRLIEGTTDVRSRIVADALQYLEALGRDAARDPELSLEIATAYQQVARVQGVPFISNLGLMPQAEESLRKADTFIDAVLATQPDNRQALLTWAQIAHDRMALVDLQNRRADALAAARAAADRLDRFFAGYSPTPDEINAATQIYSNIAIAYQNSNRFDESIRYSRRALAVSAGVESARMRRASASGVLAHSLRRVGYLDEALAAGEESRTLLEQLPLSPANQFNLINSLWRVGLVLGEDAGPSLGRADDALRAFQHGLDLAEEQASKNPSDFRSRDRVSTMALEIGNILRQSDPARALAVYDHALARLREIDANARSQAGEIDLLAMSSYAARALGREADARARLAESFKLLEAAKEYPADSIEPQSGADNALRALAAQHEAAGELARAAEIYQELMTKLEAWQVRPAEDLRDATILSNTWTARARLLRRLGQIEEAEPLETRRAALWTAWAQKRPNNVFVRAQLENAGRR